MTEEKKLLWQTRGIGAFRIFPGDRVCEKSLTWVKRLADHHDDASLSWYVDASQVDGEDRNIVSFGFGILAMCPNGKLVAAAYGHPPPCVSAISQAEAHAVAVA